MSRVSSFMSSLRRAPKKPQTLDGIQTVIVNILALIDAGVYVTVLRVGSNRIVKTFANNDPRGVIDLSWLMDDDWKASIDVESLNPQEKNSLLQLVNMEGIDCSVE